jgi:alpha-D-ribose 1-methylphosphonate 5-triphosphate synthase subunit PhnH
MTSPAADDALQPGLPDPVFDAQRVFRAVLDAMAHPGTILPVTLDLAAPPPLDLATAAVALALADYETPLWLDGAAATAAVKRYLGFHCGCPLNARSEEAGFAIIAAPAAMPPLAVFAGGSDEYPDRSTTLIIQVPALRGGAAWSLRGPGIADAVRFAPAGLPGPFGAWLRDNHRRFPRGVDMIFTCGAALAALPRSSRLEA